MSFTVLFVCTGNICRSPMAERLFRAGIGGGPPVFTMSAGTHALVGHGIDGPSAMALRELGVDPDGHRGQLVEARLIADADLVLTAETAHRSIITEAFPGSRQKTFTLREFARLAGEVDPLDGPDVSALRARVAELAAHRARQRPIPARGADIGDPYGARLEMARTSAAQIADAVHVVIRSLGLTGPPT